jgi:hypothetical protein
MILEDRIAIERELGVEERGNTFSFKWLWSTCAMMIIIH